MMNNRAEEVVAALEEFLDGRDPAFETKRTWHIREQLRSQIRARLVGAIDDLLNDAEPSPGAEDDESSPIKECDHCKGRGTVRRMPMHHRLAISRAHGRRSELARLGETVEDAVLGDEEADEKEAR